MDIETVSLVEGTLGESYTEILSASGGCPPYTWDVFSGSLPDGLELDSSGVISGVPTRVQTSDFTIVVYDSLFAWKTKDLSIMIKETTRIEHTFEGEMPRESDLLQNYPNPFNICTAICYTLPETRYKSEDAGQYRSVREGSQSLSFVSLRIYDILGKEVRILVNQPKRVGESYCVSWDGRDTFGREIANGLYFCRLEAGGFTFTKKMVALK